MQFVVESNLLITYLHYTVFFEFGRYVVSVDWSIGLSLVKIVSDDETNDTQDSVKLS